MGLVTDILNLSWKHLLLLLFCEAISLIIELHHVCRVDFPLFFDDVEHHDRDDLLKEHNNISWQSCAEQRHMHSYLKGIDHEHEVFHRHSSPKDQVENQQDPEHYVQG